MKKEIKSIKLPVKGKKQPKSTKAITNERTQAKLLFHTISFPVNDITNSKLHEKKYHLKFCLMSDIKTLIIYKY